MQLKVSIVIPCYNKVDCAHSMFNSLIRQTWDNIELILVNDGSTDGTRDVIGEYEPRFLARGFEVVIIDQENKGLAHAVHEGLKRISGEFVCQVDVDDELEPEYVSAMAGWLTEHPEYEWAACDYIRIYDGFTTHEPTFPSVAEADCSIEKWILRRYNMAVWIYMVRTKYFKQCNVLENFCIDKRGSQESQFIFPLIIGKGKLKYLPIPLYKYYFTHPETHHSYRKNMEDKITYLQGWKCTVHMTIGSLLIDSAEVRRLRALLEIEHLIDVIRIINNNPCSEGLAKEYANKLIRLVADSFDCASYIPTDYINLNLPLFCTAIRDNILGTPPTNVAIPRGRVIAWGALGKNARIVLPRLIGTPIVPSELWDAAGDGVNIKKPNPKNLDENDIVLVLPSARVAESAVCTAIERTACSNFFRFGEIMSYLAPIKFPTFYNGGTRFAIRGEKRI